MADTDLRSQLAAMQASLRHIEAAVDRAEKARDKMDDKLDTVRDRVTTLEASMPNRADVEGNKAHGEADDARRDERERIGDNSRANRSAVVTILSLIVAALALGMDIVWP